MFLSFATANQFHKYERTNSVRSRSDLIFWPAGTYLQPDYVLNNFYPHDPISYNPIGKDLNDVSLNDLNPIEFMR